APAAAAPVPASDALSASSAVTLAAGAASAVTDGEVVSGVAEVASVSAPLTDAVVSSSLSEAGTLSATALSAVSAAEDASGAVSGSLAAVSPAGSSLVPACGVAGVMPTTLFGAVTLPSELVAAGRS